MAIELTPSQENYLELIWRLNTQGPVRVGAIARCANVRLPSVTKAVARLVEAGLVRHESYGSVVFTKLGKEAAQSIVRRDTCLFGLLTELLEMEQKQAAAEVCRIEHVISDEVLMRLEVLLTHAMDQSSASWRARLSGKLGNLQPEHGQVQVGRNKPHPGTGRAGELLLDNPEH